MEATIDGWCDDAFLEVGEAFVGNFAERGDVGAAVSVMVGGQEVVNLFGGWASPAAGLPWRSDTLVNFYSVGKPIVGLLALQLIDAGLIGLDDPITSVWPEYAVRQGNHHGSPCAVPPSRGAGNPRAAHQ